MEKEKAKFDVVMPDKRWELWLTNKVSETGSGNCGLFVEAEHEAEAIEKFKELLRVITNDGFEFND